MMYMADYGNEGWTDVAYYPSPVSRKTPEWLTSAVMHRTGSYKAFGALLHEVYAAVRGKQYRLAAMGLRAVLETMMISKVGDQNTFRKNLIAFHEGGYISTVQFDTINAILEAGHATTHRGFVPSEDDLQAMLDIVEGVIAAIIVHPKSASEIEKRVPPRKKH